MVTAAIDPILYISIVISLPHKW